MKMDVQLATTLLEHRESAMSCLELYMKLGLQKKNVAIFDSKGHVHQGRDNLDERKREFASKKQYKNLKEALDGAWKNFLEFLKHSYVELKNTSAFYVNLRCAKWQNEETHPSSNWSKCFPLHIWKQLWHNNRSNG